jgi:hypothetical protein
MPAGRVAEEREALAQGVHWCASTDPHGSGTGRLGLDGVADVAFGSTGGWLVVRMVPAGTTRPIDVSIQPSLVSRLVLDPAVLGVAPPDPVLEAVGERIRDLCVREGLWSPHRDGRTDLVTLVGGASFPLLGACYETGAAPLDAVPRWASTTLRQPGVRRAAEHTFPESCSRRVVRALAASLPPPTLDQPPNLFPLALGLMGGAVLGADRLATLLESAAGRHVPADHWPDTDQVRLARRLFGGVPSERAQRLLTDAATREDGPVLLARTLRLWSITRRDLRGPLPTRLANLHDACREQLPADPRPELAGARPLPPRNANRAATSRPRPRPRARPLPLGGSAGGSGVSEERRAEPPPAPPDPRSAARFAPVASRPDLGGTEPIPVPAPLVALDGLSVGDLRLVLPRTVAELSEWGRRLSNCLGTFGAAAISGRSWLVGIEKHGRLVACAEIHPDRYVRQFLAERNRRPVPVDAERVIERLLAAGVLDAAHPGNRPWLAVLDGLHGAPPAVR